MKTKIGIKKENHYYMKTKKVIEVTGEELIAMCLHDMTISEFRESGIKTDSPSITWEIKSTGNPDRGDYKEFVVGLTIEIEC